jgi:hypothetical protein
MSHLTPKDARMARRHKANFRRQNCYKPQYPLLEPAAWTDPHRRLSRIESIQSALQLIGGRIPLRYLLRQQLLHNGIERLRHGRFTELTGGGFSRNSATDTSAVEPPLKGGFPVAIW